MPTARHVACRDVPGRLRMAEALGARPALRIALPAHLRGLPGADHHTGGGEARLFYGFPVQRLQAMPEPAAALAPSPHVGRPAGRAVALSPQWAGSHDSASKEPSGGPQPIGAPPRTILSVVEPTERPFGFPCQMPGVPEAEPGAPRQRERDRPAPREGGHSPARAGRAVAALFWRRTGFGRLRGLRHGALPHTTSPIVDRLADATGGRSTAVGLALSRRGLPRQSAAPQTPVRRLQPQP